MPAKIVYGRILSVADEITQVEIYQKKDRKYYLNITYNESCLDFKHNNKYLAMDIGVSKHTMVDSDDNLSKVINKRPDKHWNLKSNRYNPD